MSRFRIAAVTATVLIASTTALPASAQSARQILEATAERYQQRMQGIENYTIVQDMMGMESTMYFEKEMVDGAPVFHARSARMGNQSIPIDGDQTMSNPYRQFSQLASRARLSGTESINGKRTHRLVVEDFTGLDINPTPAGQPQGSFAIERMTFYIDTDQHLLHRMEIEGMVSSDGRTTPITTTASFDDYRTTDGLLHPWKTTISTSGIMEASGMSAEDRQQARTQLAELERQLESMPAAQRRVMGRMMDGQLKKLREMVDTGSMEMAMQVREIRVNQGP